MRGGIYRGDTGGSPLRAWPCGLQDQVCVWGLWRTESVCFVCGSVLYVGPCVVYVSMPSLKSSIQGPVPSDCPCGSFDPFLLPCPLPSAHQGPALLRGSAFELWSVLLILSVARLVSIVQPSLHCFPRDMLHPPGPDPVTPSPSLGICFFSGADGNRYHLRCYMYQARDLPAMDKDSFSGRCREWGELGPAAESWEQS